MRNISDWKERKVFFCQESSLNPCNFFDLFRHLESEFKFCQPLVNKNRLENPNELNALPRYKSRMEYLSFQYNKTSTFI